MITKISPEQIVIRPPVEAYSVLIPVTGGCSWNKCRFCGTYKGIYGVTQDYAIRNIDDVKKDIDKLLESEKEKLKKQRLRQQGIVQVVSACLLPLFIGIGMTSFLALANLLPAHVFFAVTVLILVYSSASGVFEYIRIKKTGKKRSFLITFSQSLLFVLIYIILLNLLN